IVKTAGAVRLIGSKQGPVPVPGETIDSLKIMVSADHAVTTGHRLHKGDKVIVLHGPFAGVTGTFTRYGGKGRVVVNIEALGQYAGVEVDEDDIEIVPKILT
ncbi:MAG: transcriptional antiterminator, partial [Desulfobacterales bacterium]